MLPEIVLALARNSPAGLVSRRAMRRVKVTDAMIMDWRIAGWLRKEVHGWYSLPQDPVPADRCLHLPLEYAKPFGSVPPAVLTGSAVLARRGVPGFALPRRPTLLVQRGNRIRVKKAPWMTVQADLRGVNVEQSFGLRLTTPARALADLSREDIEEAALIQAIDDTRNHLRVDLLELLDEWDRLRKHQHHIGAGRLVRMAESGLLDAESAGERRAVEALFATNPPAPDLQVQVTSRHRADMAFVFAGLILEYYGREVHAGQVDRDAVRVHTLRSAYWDVYVIVSSMLRYADEVAAEIHERRREREVGILEGRIRRPALPRQSRRLPLRTAVPLG